MGLTACAQDSDIPVRGTASHCGYAPKVKELSLRNVEVLTKIDTGMVEAQNDFGLRLHQALSNNPDYRSDNLIISPYSVTQALALAYNGTAGGTPPRCPTYLDGRHERG